MMLSASPRPSATPLSLPLSILWWRLVIFVTRAADKAMTITLPLVLPLRPFWWIPAGAAIFGFFFGLGAILVIR